jgi:adenine-specific DNA-methyltransferase
VSDGVVWNDAAGSPTLTIPFEYRPLTAQEAVTYGNTGQQDRMIEGALNAVPERLKANPSALAALTAERRKDAQGNPVSFLAHHLRQYATRNTRDFFIHKDLKGFLSRELDFYLKSEVLNLEEMEAAGSALAEGWFQTMRLIKKVGGHIIEFLAQIEEFQKMLWEKKKFVTETFYCITVGNIPEEFYPEIAENEAQWEEWRALLHVDEGQENLFTVGKAKKEKRLEFLKNHPTLPLDTRRFPSDFTARLLASFANLDEMTDGLLVHGENWQTLNLLAEKYRERVKCVHIDPPYNTQTSGFLYKNDYQHSSWLAMMENRISLSYRLVALPYGSFLCHIDENEFERLHLVLENMPNHNAGTLVWDKRNPMTAGRGVATQHEYVVWRSDTDCSIYLRNKNIQMMLNKARELVERYGGVTQNVKKAYADWVSSHPDLSGGEKAYRYIDEQGRIYRGVSLRAPEPRTDPKFHQPLIHPVAGKPCPVPPNGFSRTPETLKTMVKSGEILFGPDEKTQPQQKRFLTTESRRQISSVIQDARRGKADLDALGLSDFPYCHAVPFYMELVGAATENDGDLVLDYFAGSGTTGHAVINLNREGGGRRKFILVEMAQYFDTVLLPRIKKVTFSPEWKDGKPKRMATAEEAERSPRIVKVIRLESYEDALNNIAFDEESGQKALDLFGEEYMLHYMLKWESKKSETLLDVEKLQAPFSYKLNIHRDLSAGQAGGETRERVVDLPETFNYLIGLDVKTRKVFADNGRRYLVCRGTTREGRNVAVIWRDTKDWKQTDYERDEQFVKEQNIAANADEIFVNGDSYIPGAQSLDGLFKARMFADVKG